MVAMNCHFSSVVLTVFYVLAIALWRPRLGAGGACGCLLDYEDCLFLAILKRYHRAPASSWKAIYPVAQGLVGLPQ